MVMSVMQPATFGDENSVMLGLRGMQHYGMQQMVECLLL
jgi:hypothetical protein